MNEAILQLFSSLPLQGPGSDLETTRILRTIMNDLPAKPSVADFGCGTGRSTMVLATTLQDATITALDSAPVFIDVLQKSVDQSGLGNRVRPVVGDMLSPPSRAGTLDLIWSEGAAYAVGFAAALQAWQPLLRAEGRCVVSECEWLSDERPQSVAAFWRENYPDMGTREENTRRARAAGFDVLNTHVLSDMAWDGYYGALTAALDAAPSGSIPTWFASAIAQEVEIRKQAQNSFGYVFYVLRPLKG